MITTTEFQPQGIDQPPPPTRDIRDNGGGAGGAGSGDGSGSVENRGVWCGFIVDGNCLVGSVIASVVVYIVGFLF